MEITNQSNRASSDRLSSLPDSILCHILSSLPTKSAVATSILAKRWRFLWTDLSNFDFDFENHKAKSGDHQMTIPDIINTFRNVQRINTFRLSYKEEVYSEDQLDFSSDQLGTWIGSIISRNVQALDLCLLYLLRLPSCIFTCTTLVDLRLNRCVGIPSTVCLPNLKKLHLHLVKYEADETFPCLISGCAILEELMVHHIINRYSVCDKISSSTIKWLALSFEPGMGHDFYDHKLEINTPAVRYLRLEDHVSERISAGTMNSLVEADIWLNNDKVNDDDLYSHSVFEFIEKLCQVQCLRFLSGYPKFLDSVFGLATLMFNNLTKLELGADWRFLMKFLDSADNLEILIISDVDEELKRWMEPQVVPMCLSSRLRQVTINPFGCSEDEFKMASYILKNAKVSNMMDIFAQYLGCDFEAKFNALHRISLMERASDTCKLAFF